MPTVAQVKLQHLYVALRRVDIFILVSCNVHLAKSDRDLYSRSA